MRTLTTPLRGLLVPCVLAAAAGCAGNRAASGSGSDKAEEIVGIQSRQEGDLTVKMFDLFHTGRPDVWEYYKTVTDPATGRSRLRLVRKEMDLNDDGKVDVTRYYDENEKVVKEELDLDFEGKVDEVIYFDDRGLPTKKEVLDANGRPNLWKYYENGQMVRIERDTKGTGKVDTWEYWVDGKLDRIGVDTVGDGVVHRWERNGGG
jgi:hypothetical protein